MLQQAIQYNCENVKEIQNICAPLVNLLGINLIHYRKFYLQGGLINIFNHPKWMEISYANQYWHSSVFHSKIKQLIQKPTLYYLWPILPLTDPVYIGLYENNIWNGITIYKKYADSIETYAFASTRENENLRDMYFSEIENIEHFIDYFRSKIFLLTSPVEKRILIPYELNFSTKVSVKDELREKFLADTQITEFYLRSQGQYIKITKREEECMALLSHGKKTKEIANVLSLSPRTVECHLENARQRTGCNTTSQLVILYQQNRGESCFHQMH